MPELVLEGTWEEVSRRAEELAGKRVRVVVLPEEVDPGLSADEWWSLTPRERARAFREWAESLPRDRPSLSDEAMSRESIYEPDP